MPRDKFTPATKSKLAQAANCHCVRPGCAQLTHAYNPKTDSIVNLGAAAHDSAAAPGGARYDEDWSPAQRKAYANGAWLCMWCATLVDRLEYLYPLGTLANWQHQASNILLGLVQTPLPNYMIDFTVARDFAKRFCDRVATISSLGQDRFNPALSWADKCRIQELHNDCLPNGPLFCVQHAHTANLQQRVVADLMAINNEMATSAWWFDQNAQCFRLAQALGHEERALAQAASDRVVLLLSDVQTAVEELREFSLGRVCQASLAGW